MCHVSAFSCHRSCPLLLTVADRGLITFVKILWNVRKSGAWRSFISSQFRRNFCVARCSDTAVQENKNSASKWSGIRHKIILFVCLSLNKCRFSVFIGDGNLKHDFRNLKKTFSLHRRFGGTGTVLINISVGYFFCDLWKKDPARIIHLIYKLTNASFIRLVPW